MPGDSTHSKPAPKFRRRAAARPDEVLDAATALFTSRGYGATSVEAVARKAGISKGAVYLYFPSKQAILEGLVKRALAPVAGSFTGLAATPPGNAREAIGKLLIMVGAQMGRPEVLAVPRIILHEALAAPEIAEMFRTQVLDLTLPALIGLIAHGIAEGEFRAVDPELTARSVMGPLIAHLLLAEVFAITPKGGLMSEALVENHLSILFDGLALKERKSP